MRRSDWCKHAGRLLTVAVLLLAMTAVARADGGPQHRAPYRPLQFGTSGGSWEDRPGPRCEGATGTLGGLVQDVGGNQYILSNNHVLAQLNRAPPGMDIIQPGLAEVGCVDAANRVVADLTTFVPIERGQATNTVDAAIALVRSGKLDPTVPGYVLDIGVLSNQTASDNVDCAVQKSGRTTGITLGTIAAVNVTVRVRYPGMMATFSDQFLVTPGSFSAPGDSGSVIVRHEAPGPRAVGLLFAGSPSSTIGNPMQTVLTELGTPLGLAMVGSAGTGTNCPVLTQLTSEARAAARGTKGRHEAGLLQVPGVVGVGVGRGPAIEVYLANENAEARRQVPPQLDGLPVRVIVTGEFEAR